MNFKRIVIFVLVIFAVSSCSKSGNDPGSGAEPEIPANEATPAYANMMIGTDKAAYNPGDAVTFAIDNSSLPSNAKVRYKHFDTVISDGNSIVGNKWNWIVPGNDYTGYMAEVYSGDNGSETIYATVAIDVSSDWKKFPRYGFLSKYPEMSLEEIDNVISNLNRYHINGLQFYDWQNKHHQPLPVVRGSPASVWKDIINRDIYFNTVHNYISAVHFRNMKAMFYNLVYGAWDNAEADGVQKEWYVYTDNTHTNRDFHPLSSPFLSNIYLLDPSNTGWQQYIENENRKVYQFLNFDGYHMDQLGDRGTRYRYDGSFLDLAKTYEPFIKAIKGDEPGKDVVMNAVNQYGQQGIAAASPGFLYTEVWSPFDKYSDLANLIKQNNQLSDDTKSTVLAAYMNYDLANNKGYFNTPSVLMTDAVIFAFGGAHLELGEHMLGKEYFPNDNLSMKEDLKSALPDYYDFMVAYENLLRDGGSFNSVTLTSDDGKMKIADWPAYQGAVAAFGKEVSGAQVIHLINFTNSKTQNWRDNQGIQAAPVVIKDARLTFTSGASVKKIWTASPDFIGGASRSLNFIQTGNKVSFVVPELKYWDMIVVEY